MFDQSMLLNTPIAEIEVSLIPVKSAVSYGSRFFTYCSLYKINYLLNKCQKKNPE